MPLGRFRVFRADAFFFFFSSFFFSAAAEESSHILVSDLEIGSLIAERYYGAYAGSIRAAQHFDCGPRVREMRPQFGKRLFVCTRREIYCKNYCSTRKEIVSVRASEQEPNETFGDEKRYVSAVMSLLSRPKTSAEHSVSAF